MELLQEEKVSEISQKLQPTFTTKRRRTFIAPIIDSHMKMVDNSQSEIISANQN